MQNDLSIKKIKDCEIFFDLIYNEKFDLAIKCLENQIYPLVVQNHAFGQNEPGDRDLPLEFSAEKENHLIKDELNLIKFQSGKYRWESFVPKGKLVKVYKKAFSDNKSPAFHSRNGFFHRDMLVKWFIDNFSRSYEFDLIAFHVDATREGFEILKNDKITIYLTDKFPAFDYRIKKAKLSLDKVKHETAINWMLKKIRKVARLSECEVMALIAEQKKQSGSQWVEKDGIFEIAYEHGVDFSTFKTVGESGLIVGEASIKDIIEKINFTSIPLSELYSIFDSNFYCKEEKTKLFDEIFNKFNLSKNFEDLSDLTVRCFFKAKWYDEDDKTKLFYSIVDRVDITENFVGLLDLIIRFEDKYYQDNNDYYGQMDYRFYILEDFYQDVLENHPEVIMKEFPEVLKVINNSILSDSYFRIYTFCDVIGTIKNTDIMKKYLSLIEDEFEMLLLFIAGLPDWLGKHAPEKWEFFGNLPDIVEGTDLLRKDFPNFSKLMKFYPSREKRGSHYVKRFNVINIDEYFQESSIELYSVPIERFEANFLLFLYTLINYEYDNNVVDDDHRHDHHDDNFLMREAQYLELIKIFDILLEKFDEIQRDEEIFNLFYKFFKALRYKKYALTKATLTNKIAKFATNLSVIKERYPEMLEEYERNKTDQIPEGLVEKNIAIKDLFNKQEGDTPFQGLELSEHKAPYFTKLIELILRNEPFYNYNYIDSYMSELHSFTALIEGQPLTESQWSRLLHVFEIMIKNFYKIQIDKEWYVASSFVEILLQKKPRIVKQIFLSKISVFIANLNAIKKRFPEEWNEFPREKEDNDRQEINKILREEFE